jgi:xylose isomerase
MTHFYSLKEPVKYEGPHSSNPLAFAGTTRTQKVLGKTHGGPLALCRVLLAHAVLAGRLDPSAATPSTANGTTWQMRWRRPA